MKINSTSIGRYRSVTDGFSVQFVADARSAIARNWISYLLDQGVEVHLISTVAAPVFDQRIATFHVVPLALGGFVSRLRPAGPSPTANGFRRWLASRLSPLRSRAASWDVFRHAETIRNIVCGNAPSVVHAMRLPYEGIAAAAAVSGVDVPLLVSVWGNDFTLHAHRSRRVAGMIRAALKRADALHPDCQRDLDLANHYGWSTAKPAMVLPGGGGVQRSVFRPGGKDPELLRSLGIPSGSTIVFNPRRISPYVANECFFEAVSQVSRERDDVIFLAAEMKGHPVAEKWVRDFGIEQSVRLLDPMTRPDMARHFKIAEIVVSPGRHDGTPNSLIEGIACGCFPVVGAVASVEEWIDHGVNGLTCNQDDPAEIAAAICCALDDAALRESARAYNQKMIEDRADYGKVMSEAMAFYVQVIESTHGAAKYERTSSEFLLRKSA